MIIMFIQLITENLFTRSQLEGAWRNAGADVGVEGPDGGPSLIVIDLTLPDAVDNIRSLRQRYPGVEILAFAPHLDGESFKQARAAGTTSGVARAQVRDRVLAQISNSSAR